MARAKRKTNPLQSAPETALVAQIRRYRCAAYVRLSAEDSNHSGADTIEDQKCLVKQYICQEATFTLAGLYCDNGQTGASFDRPEFARLMRDVQTGKIDCIVVKDLSRFGRNYIETGHYIERVFPFLGIRLISINDHFDTAATHADGDHFIVPLKNMINEIYCKDISKKVGGALREKQKKGEFIGDWAPYGYRKCADHPNRLEIEPATAPVVRQIFQWRLEGVAYSAIARRLNEAGVLCPSRRLYETGVVTSVKYADTLWSRGMVKWILFNPAYAGHMAQGKRRQSLAQGKRRAAVASDAWQIVRHTHEPIVDEAAFAQVQEIKAQKIAVNKARLGKYDHLGTIENIFRGKVFCATCNRRMIRHKYVRDNGTRLCYVFQCATHIHHAARCVTRDLYETELKEIVRQAIQRQIQAAVEVQNIVSEWFQSSSYQKKAGAAARRMTVLRRTMERGRIFFEGLYQSYCDQMITEREYLVRKRRYAQEMEEARQELSALQAAQAARRLITSENAFLQAFQAFENAAVLTRDMVEACIEGIEVAADRRLQVVFRHRDEYDALLSEWSLGETATWKS